MINEDFDPNSIDPETEARIAALVLGEASDLERAQLLEMIAKHPELEKIKKQYESVHGILSEIGEHELAEPDDDWKLSDGKRNHVLSVIAGEGDAIDSPVFDEQNTKIEAASKLQQAWLAGSKLLTKGRAVTLVVGCAVVLIAVGLFLPSVQMAREAASKVALIELPDSADAATSEFKGFEDNALGLENTVSVSPEDFLGTQSEAPRLYAVEKNSDLFFAEPNQATLSLSAERQKEKALSQAGDSLASLKDSLSFSQDQVFQPGQAIPFSGKTESLTQDSFQSAIPAFGGFDVAGVEAKLGQAVTAVEEQESLLERPGSGRGNASGSRVAGGGHAGGGGGLGGGGFGGFGGGGIASNVDESVRGRFESGAESSFSSADTTRPSLGFPSVDADPGRTQTYAVVPPQQSPPTTWMFEQVPSGDAAAPPSDVTLAREFSTPAAPKSESSKTEYELALDNISVPEGGSILLGGIKRYREPSSQPQADDLASRAPTSPQFDDSINGDFFAYGIGNSPGQSGLPVEQNWERTTRNPSSRLDAPEIAGSEFGLESLGKGLAPRTFDKAQAGGEYGYRFSGSDQSGGNQSSSQGNGQPQKPSGLQRGQQQAETQLSFGSTFQRGESGELGSSKAGYGDYGGEGSESGAYAGAMFGNQGGNQRGGQQSAAGRITLGGKVSDEPYQRAIGIPEATSEPAANAGAATGGMALGGMAMGPSASNGIVAGTPPTTSNDARGYLSLPDGENRFDSYAANSDYAQSIQPNARRDLRLFDLDATQSGNQSGNENGTLRFGLADAEGIELDEELLTVDEAAIPYDDRFVEPSLSRRAGQLDTAQGQNWRELVDDAGKALPELREQYKDSNEFIDPQLQLNKKFLPAQQAQQQNIPSWGIPGNRTDVSDADFDGLADGAVAYGDLDDKISARDFSEAKRQLLESKEKAIDGGLGIDPQIQVPQLGRLFKNQADSKVLSVTPRIIIQEEEETEPSAEPTLSKNPYPKYKPEESIRRYYKSTESSEEKQSITSAAKASPATKTRGLGLQAESGLQPLAAEEFYDQEVAGEPSNWYSRATEALKQLDDTQVDVSEMKALRGSALKANAAKAKAKVRIAVDAEKAAEPTIASRLRRATRSENAVSEGKKVTPAAQPVAGLNELSADAEAFSTFSLHVSDVSFKLALNELSQGKWPEQSKVRIEEFVNAFDYRDPMPTCDEKVACQLEQSIHPFLQQRNVLRLSMRTAEMGRSSTTPLRLTLLLDNSGSMERPDRRQTVRKAFELLTQQFNDTDQVTLLSFARTPRLLADKVAGKKAAGLSQLIQDLPSQGGTNIEAALKLAFEKAKEQFDASAQNRIVLLTDGAVNLGNANPEELSNLVESMREAGIAFDAAGISAKDLNDEVLEALTRKGDGRYYLLNSIEDADGQFAQQIAGALRPAAKNVKIQVEFNPHRVGKYKLLGFEKHRLKKEDFRNDAVDAAEMAAAEAGVAVYQFEAKPDGQGDVGSVSVRFQDLATGQMVERRWPIPYEPDAQRASQGAPALQIATCAAMLAAKLKGETLGEFVDLQELSAMLNGLPAKFRSIERVQQMQNMLTLARQLDGSGK